VREQLIKNIEELLNRGNPEELKSTLTISVIDLFIEALDELIKEEVKHVNNALNEKENQPNIRQASLCYEAMGAYATLKESLSEPEEETV
jgi:hypothetical protein